MTSPNVRSRPWLSIRTETVSQSRDAEALASAGLMWMWRRAQITPAESVIRPSRPFERHAGCIGEVTGNAHRRIDAQDEFIAARDLHLVVRARRAHEPHVVEVAARADQPHASPAPRIARSATARSLAAAGSRAEQLLDRSPG